tara:strand:- start:216 stop:362 length:147 start_codon:yes stop_codon:yes gene_type:complete
MKYYKKPNGTLIEYDPNNHDEESLKDRFEECDKDGNKIEKKPKAKKKK